MGPDARTAASLAGVLYAFGYLYALGDLDLVSGSSWGAMLGEPERWLDQRGLLQFEAIAMLELGGLLFLVSPLNLLLAGLLGGLLAVNLHGAWLLWRYPGVCDLTHARGSAAGGSGVLAALPALLAGGACCAPSILLLVGIPGLGAFAGLFGWLLPLSIALLMASRIWQRHRGAPPWFRLSGARR